MPDRACPAGIGLRAPHYREIAQRLPPLDFLEVHAENFFGDGGPSLAWLERFRRDYPLSVHGVGLSLGSVDPIDEEHLARLAALVARFEPMLVSEHLCWTSFAGRHAHDLLPLPCNEEAIAHVVPRIQAVQERLGRALAIENVTAYVRFAESTLGEAQFLDEVARRAGCGILLDVSNAWANAANHALDARAAIDAIDRRRVVQYHLAGCERDRHGCIIDSHAAPVAEESWALFAYALERIGPRPVAIERDARIPPLDELLAEAARAAACRPTVRSVGAGEHVA